LWIDLETKTVKRPLMEKEGEKVEKVEVYLQRKNFLLTKRTFISRPKGVGEGKTARNLRHEGAAKKKWRLKKKKRWGAPPKKIEDTEESSKGERSSAGGGKWATKKRGIPVKKNRRTELGGGWSPRKQNHRLRKNEEPVP